MVLVRLRSSKLERLVFEQWADRVVQIAVQLIKCRYGRVSDEQRDHRNLVVGVPRAFDGYGDLLPNEVCLPVCRTLVQCIQPIRSDDDQDHL